MLGLGNALTTGVSVGRFPCMHLDGTDDYVNVPHHADLKITSQITVSAWVNLDTIWGATGWVNPDTDDSDDHNECPIGTIHVGGWRIGIEYGGTAANPSTKIFWELKVDDTGSGSAGYIKPIWGGVTQTTGSTTLHEIKDFNGWVHIAGTFRAGVATLFINGSSDLNIGAVDTSEDQVVDTGVSGGVLVYANNTHVMIGADAAHNTNNVGGEFLKGGLMSETAIWSIALPGAAVLEIYKGGKPGLNLLENQGNYNNSDTLLGYWKLDTNPEDSGSGSHDGNPNNSPSFVEI